MKKKLTVRNYRELKKILGAFVASFLGLIVSPAQVGMPQANEVNLFGVNRFDGGAITRIYSSKTNDSGLINVFAKRLYLGGTTNDNVVTYTSSDLKRTNITVFVDELIIDCPVRFHINHPNSYLNFIANTIRIGPSGVVTGYSFGGNGVFVFAAKEIIHDASIQPPIKGTPSREKIVRDNLGAQAANALQSAEVGSVVVQGIKYKYGLNGAVLIENTGILLPPPGQTTLEKSMNRNPDFAALYGIMEAEALRERTQPQKLPLQFAASVQRVTAIMEELQIPARKDILERKKAILDWLTTIPTPLKIASTESSSLPNYWIDIRKKMVYSAPGMILIEPTDQFAGLLVTDTSDDIKLNVRGRFTYAHPYHESIMKTTFSDGGKVEFGGLFDGLEISGAQIEIPGINDTSSSVNVVNDRLAFTITFPASVAAQALSLLRSDGIAWFRCNYKAKNNPNESGTMSIPISLNRWNSDLVKLVNKEGIYIIQNVAKRSVRVEYALINGKVKIFDEVLEIRPGEAVNLSGSITSANNEDVVIPREAVTLFYDSTAKLGLADLNVAANSSLVRKFKIKNFVPLDLEGFGRLHHVECSIIYSEKSGDPGNQWIERLEGPVNLAASGAVGSEQEIAFLINPSLEWRAKLSGTAFYGDAGKNAIALSTAWDSSLLLQITKPALKINE